MEEQKGYTLITGASKGIGKAFAFECARRNMNLLLIARNQELLSSLKELIISSYPIKVEYLAADLVTEKGIIQIIDFINEKSISVNMLINNAGSGCYGNFAKASLTKNLEVTKLNIEACLKLTHWFLGHYDKSKRAYLMNVISTSAFQPIPNLGIYAASKAFMLSFTKTLRYEQKSQNLFITALCPGGTDSEFFADANMVHVSEKNRKWLMAPSEIALIGMESLLKNKKLIIPGFYNKLHVFLTKIIPEQIIFLFTAKIYK